MLKELIENLLRIAVFLQFDDDANSFQNSELRWVSVDATLVFATQLVLAVSRAVAAPIVFGGVVVSTTPNSAFSAHHH
mgnify:CR=1 FL=1